MKKIIIFLIKFYQKTLSPDHSPFLRGLYPYGYCKYYPSCSEYARQAVELHGSIKGSYMAALRLFKCNPFSSGGVDLVIKI